MKIASRTFRRDDWYVTSAFGWRTDPFTKKRKYHSGTDYGTKGEKWKQYALEDGTVISAGTSSSGAKNCWIKYPRLGIRLQYYHLDTLNVKKGQKVTKDTVIGTTGKTGKATGIHLHLGMKYEKDLNTYVNPHAYDYIEAPKPAEWKTGYYTLLYEKYLRKNHNLTNNIVKVKDCTKAMQKALTSKKPNDKAKIKAGTTITILEIYTDNTGRVWGKNYSGWVVLCNKDGSPQAKKA